MHTPASVHDGSAVKIHANAATLDAAFVAHPERFRGRTAAARHRARPSVDQPATREWMCSRTGSGITSATPGWTAEAPRET